MHLLINDNPIVLEEAPYEVKQVMQTLRPGSISDYAKYFAGALGALPVINNMDSK